MDAPLLGAKLGNDDEPPGAYGAMRPPSAPYDGMTRVPDTREVHRPAFSTDSSTGVYCCTTPLAGFLGILCCPLTVLGMPTTVPPRHEAVGTVFGRYVATWKASGLYFINPCGLNLRYVSVNNRTHELQSIKVADAMGNSLVVSGVITYRVVDTTKAALDMVEFEQYVRTQAHGTKAWVCTPGVARVADRGLCFASAAVLKRLCSRFPYITYDASPSLMTEQSALGGQLAQMLQEKVDVAGVHVLSYELVDLSYSAEIAPQMLVRQQAQAIVDARKTVVAGAVGIVGDALESLRDRGIEVAGADQPRFVGNLMTVLCSEKSPVPTIDM